MEKEINIPIKESDNLTIKGNKKLIIHIVLHVLMYVFVAFITVTAANKAYDFTYQIYGKVAVSKKATKTKEITVKEGDSALQIADELYKEKLIVNKYSFFIRVKLSEKAIQPGTYEIKNNMTYDQIIKTISIISEEDEK